MKQDFYLARDITGTLWLFDHKPVLENDGGFTYTGSEVYDLMRIYGDFPEVTHENSPKKITFELYDEDKDVVYEVEQKLGDKWLLCGVDNTYEEARQHIKDLNADDCEFRILMVTRQVAD